MATTIPIHFKSSHTPSYNFNVPLCNVFPRRHNVAFCIAPDESHQRSSFALNQPRGGDHMNRLKPVYAIGSGFEATMEDIKGNTLELKKAEFVVESQDADKMKLRVDVTGEDTKKAFDVILSNLAKSAPPIPGFRRQKGGKNALIPKDMLLYLIGEDRVTRFVIREIVTSAVAIYVEKENLTVMNDKINTTQSEDELKKSFSPGNSFGFNVEFELAQDENETATNDLTTSDTIANDS